MKLKLSVSAGIHLLNDDTFIRALKDCGIFHIHADGAKPSALGEEAQREYLMALETQVLFATERGITTDAFHAPFGLLWSIESDDEAVRTESVKRCIDLSARLEKLPVKYLILHTNGGDFKIGKDRETGISQLRKSLSEICEKTEIRVLIENLPRNCLGNCAEEMLRIIDGLPVGTVLDTNHIFKESLQEYVERMAGTIEALHISDNDGIDERHWLPGEGSLDWRAFKKTLAAAGYCGTLNYETHIGVPEDLCKVRENAEKIFSDIL